MMVRRCKRLFVCLLALVVFSSAILPAFATTGDIDNNEYLDSEIQNKMLRILSAVESEKEYYGLENVNFSSIAIGNEILTYRVQNGMLTNAGIRIFPVISDNELVSLFYVATLPNGELYIQLSNQLVAPLLEEAGDNPVAIVYDDEGAYVYTDQELRFLGSEVGALETVDDDVNISALNALQSSNALDYAHSLTAETMQDIEARAIEVCQTLDVSNVESQRQAAVANLPPAVSLQVDIIPQPTGTNICWAIAVTSIVNKVFNLNYTYETIVELFTFGQDIGRYIEDVFYRFNAVFNTTWLYEYTTTINPLVALTYLNAGYPLYGDFTQQNGAHAVVIRGINTYTRTFSVMNPNPTTSGYTAGTISNDNVWTFISEYSGTLYTLRSYGYPGQI